jgi:hypothetical protein
MRRYLLSGASLGAGIDASMHKSGGGLPRASGAGVGKVDHSANVGQMRQPPFIHPALYAYVVLLRKRLYSCVYIVLTKRCYSTSFHLREWQRLTLIRNDLLPDNACDSSMRGTMSPEKG